MRALTIKDYIKHPKPNGYKSLHALIAIPAFLSTGPMQVPVEVQVRTVAMDFWASLEHKIFYKYEGGVPPHLADSLTAAAGTSGRPRNRWSSFAPRCATPGAVTMTTWKRTLSA